MFEALAEEITHRVAEQIPVPCVVHFEFQDVLLPILGVETHEVLIMDFLVEGRMWRSWASDRPGGWDPAQKSLESIVRYVVACWRRLAKRIAAENQGAAHA